MEDGEKHTEMEKGGRNLFITRTKKICPIIREREKKKEGEMQKRKDLRKDHEMESIRRSENRNYKMK